MPQAAPVAVVRMTVAVVRMTVAVTAMDGCDDDVINLDKWWWLLLLHLPCSLAEKPRHWQQDFFPLAGVIPTPLSAFSREFWKLKQT